VIGDSSIIASIWSVLARNSRAASTGVLPGQAVSCGARQTGQAMTTTTIQRVARGEMSHVCDKFDATCAL
jgi:hypothetical protein